MNGRVPAPLPRGGRPRAVARAALAARAAVAMLAGLGAAAAPAQPASASGQWRAQALDLRADEAGPLAAAARIEPAADARPRGSAALEGELRLSGGGLSAIATLRRQRTQGAAAQTDGLVNELQYSGGGEAWQFSAGRRIVGWDVGYAWRPNDVVQQEQRRTLLGSTAVGRPLVMVEHFDARTAWSAVWVNPGASRQRRGADEPALALRAFHQRGAVDWHGFARWGRRTGGSVGAAAAWVAGESLELHASLRWVDEADTRAAPLPAAELARSDPWQPATVRRASQALVGGTWTTAGQLSLLAEAWWDGTAPTSRSWQDWRARNDALATLVATGAPAGAVAGNLRWQAAAYGAAANLHRASAYARLSWTHEAWQPSLDLLLHPADRGRLWTAALAWQGDRWRLEGGWRQAAGPEGAVLMQLPTRRSGWLASTWAY